MHRGYALFILALLFVSSSLVLAALHAHAQTDNSPITVTVSPSYPAPYQSVTITPDSQDFDMSNSTVTVYVNGSNVYKGSGTAGIPITLGGPGSATTVKVSVVNAGETFSKTITIRPASVALVVDPVSTTHPLYAGASLVAPQGRVRIVAVPDLRTSSGKILDASGLEYTWKLGDQVLQEDSGLGKSVLNATAPDRYEDANVSVLVSSQDNTLNASADTTISPVDPITRIYFNDPLLGPEYDTALDGNTVMPDTEDTYRGVGYYFSNTPSYDWTVNGAESGTANDITVRATGSGQGTANLSFTAADSSGQRTANSTLAVQFGQKGSGLFGL